LLFPKDVPNTVEVTKKKNRRAIGTMQSIDENNNAESRRSESRTSEDCMIHAFGNNVRLITTCIEKSSSHFIDTCDVISSLFLLNYMHC
jgi:small nuclear ribonucleoprotein (snRNP)-like protein